MTEKPFATGRTRIAAFALAGFLLSAFPAAAKPRKKVAKIDIQAQRLMSQGLAELRRGEFSAAISDLEKAVRRQASASSYFLLGWAHYQRGFKRGTTETADRDDAQSAIDAYNMALELDPRLSTLSDPSRLYFSLALCDEAVEAYGPSLDAYKSALRAAPNKALIPLHAARLRLKMKDEDKAVVNARMALDKARKSGHEGALIALVARDPAFAALVADKGVRDALGIAAPPAAGVFLAAEDLKGGELRDAVRDAPRPAPPAQDPAVLDQVAQGDVESKFHRYQNAIAAYERALALNEARSTLSNAQVASLYEKIGASDNKIGQADAAILPLQKSLERNSQSASAYYQIALAYAMSGRTSLSLRALKACFGAASERSELRRFVLLSKTDIELEAVRDTPEFARVVADVAGRIALR